MTTSWMITQVSTGDPRVPLPVSRIRADAVHAGPSHQLVPWKAPIKSNLVNLFPFPSNNSLTATLRAMDATVVTKVAPSLTLNLTLWRPNHLILTLVKMVLAMPHLLRELLVLKTTAEFLANQSLLSRVLFLRDPSLLPLRLTEVFSRTTALVLSALAVVNPLITLFSLLGMGLITTLSRTLGAPDGVTRVTSRSVCKTVPVAVVSSCRVTLSLLTESILYSLSTLYA